jgi:hypothetical protein
MEDISAASGWNFVAAEEYGRWVFPGGNAWLAMELWKKLRQVENAQPPSALPLLRAGCRVVDVRRVGDRVHVTWIANNGQVKTLSARAAVMAGSKHVAKHILHGLPTDDRAKYEAMQRIDTAAYLVVNVLLDAPVERDFYDIFLVSDTMFPMTPGAFESAPRPIDVLDGSFAGNQNSPRSVLTLYWPLPWASARFSLLLDEPWDHYANLLVPRLRQILTLLDLQDSDVRQVRMARWGHALPIARPEFIANGNPQELLRPYKDRIWFVNQDNWALPAVENSLLDAEWASEAIDDLIR